MMLGIYLLPACGVPCEPDQRIPLQRSTANRIKEVMAVLKEAKTATLRPGLTTTTKVWLQRKRKANPCCWISLDGLV